MRENKGSSGTQESTWMALTQQWTSEWTPWWLENWKAYLHEKHKKNSAKVIERGFPNVWSMLSFSNKPVNPRVPRKQILTSKWDFLGVSLVCLSPSIVLLQNPASSPLRRRLSIGLALQKYVGEALAIAVKISSSDSLTSNLYRSKGHPKTAFFSQKILIFSTKILGFLPSLPELEPRTDTYIWISGQRPH